MGGLPAPASPSNGSVALMTPPADKSTHHRRGAGFPALAVALAYALFATAWILGSDYLLALAFSDPRLLSTMGALKGVGFVAVTTGLLYLALRHAAASRLPETTTPAGGAGRWWLAVVMVMVLIVAVIGAHAYTAAHERNEIARLAGLAQAKAEQIGHWLEERRRDGKVAASAAPLYQAAQNWQQTDDPESRSLVLGRMHALMDIVGYETVLLVDERGSVLLGAGAAHQQISPGLQQAVIDAMGRDEGNGEAVFFTLHRSDGDAAEHVHFDLVSELPRQEGQRQLALLMRMSERDMHFPFLQDWTEGTATGEALLLRDRGVRLQVLNAPRFAYPQADLLDVSPRVAGDLVTAALREAEPGQALWGRGLDGEPALGVAAPVPGSDWRLLMKIDQAELYGDIRSDLSWGALALLLATLVAIAAGRLWTQQRTLVLQRRVDQERQQRLVVAQRHEDLVENARDIILVLDARGRVVQANAAATRAYGLGREALLGLNIRDLRAGPAQAEEDGAAPQEGLPFETRHKRADGTEFPVEVSTAIVEIDGEPHRQSIIRDISARKAAERQLDANARLLAIAARAGHIGGWDVDLVQGKVHWSDEVCRIHDMPPGTLVSIEDGLGYYAPEWRERITRKFTACVRDGAPYDEELEILTAAGRKVWVRTVGEPVRNESGAVVGVRGAFQDISERKRAQLILELQRRRADALLELPRLAETRDETSFIQRALAIAEELTGSELSFVHFVHEEQALLELATLSPRAQAQLNGEASAAHCTIGEAGRWADALRQRAALVNNDFGGDHADNADQGSADGRGLPTGLAGLRRLVSAPVIEDGKVAMLAAVANKPGDYTEIDLETVRLIAEETWRIVQKQRTQDQLRQRSLAIEQSPDSIVITDLDARIQYVNRAFIEITGYRAEELIGENPRILQSGKTPPHHYDEMWTALTNGEPWKGEFYNRRKDGSEYVEFGHIAPLRQPDGRITHYVAVKVDITEQKRVAAELDRHRHHLEQMVGERTAQLEEARARAESANQAKSAFIANMSHEIRTPLNAIVGLAHLLRSEDATPAQREKLDKIDSAADHLLSIISDILDIAKIEAGRFELDLQNFHLSAVLDHVRSLISESARAKGLSLDTDGDAVPEWLRGDPARLRQALLNLAGNAVKFTEQGSIQLRARLLGEDERGLQVRFEVEDTGSGIPAERLDHLFRAFEQVDRSVTRRYGGTGLGLAVTRGLAELMGGHAGADSVPGKGSLFWFEVQLARGHGVQPAPAREAAQRLSPREALAAHADARILLAEDNAINREVATQMLHAAGLSVDCAVDGQEALRMVREQSYDLVLMDVQMPEMDGLTATREIRKLPGMATLPILAMTANVFEEDRRAALEAGMNDFVAKPVQPEDFYQALGRWLDTRRTSDRRPPQA